MILSMPQTHTVRTAHRGPLFSVEELRLCDDAGREHAREVVRHPGAVAIVPILPPGNGSGPQVVMIRNYRVAVARPLWELPAGKLEADEPPIEAAGRELEEEAGYAAGRLTPLGAFYTSPGFADERMHVFLAEDLTPVPQRLEPGEQIEVEVRDADAVFAMIADGSIEDAKTIAGLTLWARRSGHDLRGPSA